MSRAHARWLAAALAVCATTAAHAQSPLRAQGVDVHYSAIPSTSLPVQSAQQYAITRSDARAVLIIAVRRSAPDGTGPTVPATIAGTVVNAAGASETLRLREVREGDAVSYLAEPRIAPNDVLQFDLLVSSPEIAAPIALRFAQEFFPPQAGTR